MAIMTQGIDPTRVDTVAEFPLGLVVDDPRGGVFQGNRIKYAKFGVGGGAVGQAVKLDVAAAVAERHANVLLTTNANEAIEGIVIATAVLAGQFGWIHYEGRFNGALTAATIVAGALMVTTANDGELDDTALTPSNAELQAVLTGAQVKALTIATSNRADVLVIR